ncbi:hypothetical protein FRC01_002920, partial [Tulasnella sp. 417]
VYQSLPDEIKAGFKHCPVPCTPLVFDSFDDTMRAKIRKETVVVPSTSTQDSSKSLETALHGHPPPNVLDGAPPVQSGGWRLLRTAQTLPPTQEELVGREREGAFWKKKEELSGPVVAASFSPDLVAMLRGWRVTFLDMNDELLAEAGLRVARPPAFVRAGSQAYNSRETLLHLLKSWRIILSMVSSDILSNAGIEIIPCRPRASTTNSGTTSRTFEPASPLTSLMADAEKHQTATEKQKMVKSDDLRFKAIHDGLPPHLRPQNVPRPIINLSTTANERFDDAFCKVEKKQLSELVAAEVFVDELRRSFGQDVASFVRQPFIKVSVDRAYAYIVGPNDFSKTGPDETGPDKFLLFVLSNASGGNRALGVYRSCDVMLDPLAPAEAHYNDLPDEIKMQFDTGAIPCTALVYDSFDDEVQSHIRRATVVAQPKATQELAKSSKSELIRRLYQPSSQLLLPSPSTPPVASGTEDDHRRAEAGGEINPNGAVKIRAQHFHSARNDGTIVGGTIDSRARPGHEPERLNVTSNNMVRGLCDQRLAAENTSASLKLNQISQKKQGNISINSRNEKGKGKAVEVEDENEDGQPEADGFRRGIHDSGIFAQLDHEAPCARDPVGKGVRKPGDPSKQLESFTRKTVEEEEQRDESNDAIRVGRNIAGGDEDGWESSEEDRPTNGPTTPAIPSENPTGPQNHLRPQDMTGRRPWNSDRPYPENFDQRAGQLSSPRSMSLSRDAMGLLQGWHSILLGLDEATLAQAGIRVARPRTSARSAAQSTNDNTAGIPQGLSSSTEGSFRSLLNVLEACRGSLSALPRESLAELGIEIGVRESRATPLQSGGNGNGVNDLAGSARGRGTIPLRTDIGANGPAAHSSGNRDIMPRPRQDQLNIDTRNQTMQQSQENIQGGQREASGKQQQIPGNGTDARSRKHRNTHQIRPSGANPAFGEKDGSRMDWAPFAEEELVDDRGSPIEVDSEELAPLGDGGQNGNSQRDVPSHQAPSHKIDSEKLMKQETTEVEMRPAGSTSEPSSSSNNLPANRDDGSSQQGSSKQQGSVRGGGAKSKPPKPDKSLPSSVSE